MRKLGPALAAVAVAVVVAFVALAVGSPFGSDPVEQDLAPAAANDPDDGDDEAADAGDADGGPPPWSKVRHGHGPPPWAHGFSARPDKQAHRAWQKRWHEMSPPQRERTMTRLAQQHADGMRAWAKCHSEGRDDCDKPTPPGIAKKQ